MNWPTDIWIAFICDCEVTLNYHLCHTATGLWPVESIFSDNWDPKLPTVVPSLPSIHQSLSISNYKTFYIFFLTQWRTQVRYDFPSCTNLIAVISFLFSFSLQKMFVKYIVASMVWEKLHVKIQNLRNFKEIWNLQPLAFRFDILKVNFQNWFSFWKCHYF